MDGTAGDSKIGLDSDQIQQNQNIFYSMETQNFRSNDPNQEPPTRPLEGYFRFRQEMMSSLKQEERTCENIVRLWNNLTIQQKALRMERTRIEMQQYLHSLNLWKQAQQKPLQSLENYSRTDQQAPKTAKSEPAGDCQNDAEMMLGAVHKTKIIRKAAAHATKKDAVR